MRIGHRKHGFCGGVVAALFLAGVCRGSAQADPSGGIQRPRILCTTTLASCIVTALVGSDAEAKSIVPFGMCPGHFDLTPTEAQAIREADLVLQHGYERFLRGVQPAHGRMVVVDVPGNWMLPNNHTQAIWRVAGILSASFPALETLFSERAQRYAEAVQVAIPPLLERLAPYRGIPIICSSMNKDFVAWMGLRVVAVYPRDEDVSVRGLHELIQSGRQAGAIAVLDNRQSSGKIGGVIARELGVPLAVLSNFPDPTLTGTPVYPYVREVDASITTIIETLAGITGRH